MAILPKVPPPPSGVSDTSESFTSEESSAEEGSAETSGTPSAIDMDGDPYHVVFLYMNNSEGTGFDEVSAAVNELSLQEINMETELLPVSFGTWTTTVQMMLAANERLDLFCDSASNMPAYIESGYIMNWADYLDQIPDVVDYYGDELEAGYIGDFMALIGTVKERANDYGLIVRKDIMDELGYTVDDFDIEPGVVETYEPLTEMFAAAKAAHPEMNIIDGSIVSFGIYDGLSDDLGVLPDYGQITTVVNWPETETYKNLVTITKGWYDAGYYSSDAVTNQDSDETLMKAGNLMSYVTGTKPNSAAEKKAQTGYDVYVIPLSGTSIYATTGYNAFGFCIANASENKEKAAAYYNWCFTSEAFEDLINWGIEGVDWVEDENGQAAFPEDVDGSNARYHNDMGWIYPNQTAGHVWEGNPQNIWELYEEAADSAIRSKAYGFTFDSTAVTDQIIAVNAVNAQYQKSLQYGAVDDVDEAIAIYNEALHNAGIDDIIDEKQSQLNAWCDEQGIAH